MTYIHMQAKGLLGEAAPDQLVITEYAILHTGMSHAQNSNLK